MIFPVPLPCGWTLPASLTAGLLLRYASFQPVGGSQTASLEQLRYGPRRKERSAALRLPARNLANPAPFPASTSLR